MRGNHCRVFAILRPDFLVSVASAAAACIADSASALRWDGTTPVVSCQICCTPSFEAKMLFSFAGLYLSFIVDMYSFYFILQMPNFRRARSFLEPKRSFRPAFAEFKPSAAVPD